MKTNVEVTGKMNELMDLLKDEDINSSGLNVFLDIAMEEHFVPALKDADKGPWTSETIEAWHGIFENNITLSKTVLIRGLREMIEPIAENYSGDAFYFMLNMLRSIEQISDLGDSLTHSWHNELKRLLEVQEGCAI